MAEAAEDDELWEVALSAGEQKTMTLDQLDDAYRLGIIDESTMVREMGTPDWQPLYIVAGLEPPEVEPVPPAPEPDSQAPTQRRDAGPGRRPMNQTVMGLGPGGYAAGASQALGSPATGTSVKPPPLPPNAFGERGATEVERPSQAPRRQLAEPTTATRRASYAPRAVTRAVASVPPPSRPPPSRPPARPSRAPARTSAPPPLPNRASQRPASSRPPPNANGQSGIPVASVTRSSQAPQGQAPLRSLAQASVAPAPPLTPPPAPPPKSPILDQQAPISAAPAFTADAGGIPRAPRLPADFGSTPAPVLGSATPLAEPKGVATAEWVLYGLVAAACLFTITQRNGLLYSWSKSLGLESAYLSFEKSTLGGPSLNTPRGVEQFVKNQRALIQAASKQEPKANGSSEN